MTAARWAVNQWEKFSGQRLLLISDSFCVQCSCLHCRFTQNPQHVGTSWMGSSGAHPGFNILSLIFCFILLHYFLFPLNSSKFHFYSAISSLCMISLLLIPWKMDNCSINQVSINLQCANKDTPCNWTENWNWTENVCTIYYAKRSQMSRMSEYAAFLIQYKHK